MAFDLPWCAGRSYLDVALEDRKAILRLVLRDHPRVRFGGHVERDGIAFFSAAAAQGLEGAMAKHRRSRYEAGHRSAAWLKLKVRPTQELVVAGYVPGQGSHRDLGALVVGVMDAGPPPLRGPRRERPRHGHARPPARRASMPARVRTAPFDRAPGELARTPGVVWAEPGLVIRAEIGGWSRDGIVRQASFAQEAPEVDPASVERQVAVGPEAAARALAKAASGDGRPCHPTGGWADPSGGSVDAAEQAVSPRHGRATGDAIRPARRREDAAPPAGPPARPPPHEPATAAELAALDALPGRGGTWAIGGHEIALTNLDKVLAPGAAVAPGAADCGDARQVTADPRAVNAADADAPVTKRDLVRYLVQIAPVLLPHLAGSSPQPRPLSRRDRRRVLLAEGRRARNAGLDPAVARARPARPAPPRLRRRRRAPPRSPGSATRPRSRSIHGPR